MLFSLVKSTDNMGGQPVEELMAFLDWRACMSGYGITSNLFSYLPVQSYQDKSCQDPLCEATRKQLELYYSILSINFKPLVYNLALVKYVTYLMGA